MEKDGIILYLKVTLKDFMCLKVMNTKTPSVTFST